MPRRRCACFQPLFGGAPLGYGYAYTVVMLWLFCQAHKLSPLIAKLFNVELQPVHEMESVIEGLLALHALQPEGELFTVTQQSPRDPSMAVHDSPRLLPQDGMYNAPSRAAVRRAGSVQFAPAAAPSSDHTSEELQTRAPAPAPA